MKYILSFLFICVAVQCIQADEDRLKLLKKMRKTVSTVKNMVEKAKEEKMRKLQQSTDEGGDTIPLNTIPAEIPANSPVIAPGKPVVPSTVEPVSTEDGNSTTTNGYVVKKFHNFESASNGLRFGLFFSYFEKIIRRTLNMRIVVTHGAGRLRYLPISSNESGESVPVTCVIKDEFKNSVGNEGKGENIDYLCTAPTNGEASYATVDTTSPMLVGTDSVPVTDVSFIKDSEVGDISKAKKTAIIINDATVTTEDNKIILNGYASPIEGARSKLHKGDKRNMAFYDTSSNSMKALPCTVTEVKDGVGYSLPCTLECSTESTPIRTYFGNLTEAKIDDNDLYLRVNPDLTKQNANYIINPTGGSDGYNRSYYRKSSSGLSGGAIAGIVIACVVVLAAASIAALMLRKPAPPMDQTTVVALRPGEKI